MLVKSNTKNQYFVLKIKNLGVSILYVDAFFVTRALRRTKHELTWFSGTIGSDAQIKFTQTLHRSSQTAHRCFITNHRASSSLVVFEDG